MFNLYLYKYNRLIKKIEKKFHISLFFLSIFRLFLILIEKIYFKKLDTSQVSKFSNYFLKKNMLSKKNNIISAGIADENSFEKNVFQSIEVNKMICIDPTDIAQNTMENLKSDNIFFLKCALFDKIGEIKIFKPFSKDNYNLSLDNLYQSQKYEIVKTTTIDEIIRNFELEKLDIVKLDVEGVADKVIISMLKKNIYPSQIVFEIERPMSFLRQFEFFKRTLKLVKILSKEYELYSYTEKKLGFRIEILATLKN